ncbi:MAG: MarR family transcriptional regulator [Bdellovibrionales bacterium]|jgi:DNA-binding MarR family transcriptional regulator|nr:MarR family transcriptional regulator [Bdellovibrionales bacterium]
MKIQSYLVESPLFQLIGLQKNLDQKVLSLLKGQEVSFKEGLVLLTLLFEKKSIGPGELNEALDFSKSQTSQILSKLEGARLIKRNLGTEDARKISLELTSLGAVKANELIQTFEHLDQIIEDKLGQKELRGLIRSVNILRDY